MAITYSKDLLLLVSSLIILIADVAGQAVQVNDVQTVTDCSQGLRAQQDRFIITGEVDASDVIIDNWRYIEYYAAIGGADFKSVCFFDLTSCSNTPSPGCYCVNKGGNKYQIVINQTATVEYSQSRMKSVWTKGDNTQSVESQVVQLPQIYGQNVEIVTLTVNGAQQDLTSTPCSFSLNEGRNDLSYCCTNSPSPCATKITINGIDTSGDRCLDTTVLESAAGLYRFTYTVCGRVSGTLDCEATYGSEDTRTTTVLSPTQAQSSSDDSDDLPGWGIALIVIFVVGFVAGLTVGLYCWWKKKCSSDPNVRYKNNKRATHESPDGTVTTMEHNEEYKGPASLFKDRNAHETGFNSSSNGNNALPYSHNQAVEYH